MIKGEVCWVVETSRDGERWRFFGRAWKAPGEPVLLHGASRFVRVRPVEQEAWRPALERSGDGAMSLLRMEEGSREELMPGPEHVGLPILFTGGEEGRLLRFEHQGGHAWTYAVEFRGERTW
ncbi:MAG TPA: hypothetical protein VE173_11300 [Longimicrobiales bacterium]|nr:hypothetical protein [Longimicrobiales bacterium]